MRPANGFWRRADIARLGWSPYLAAVVIDLAAAGQTGIIGAAIYYLWRNSEDGMRGNQWARLAQGPGSKSERATVIRG